jgi:hypothetical protein
MVIVMVIVAMEATEVKKVVGLVVASFLVKEVVGLVVASFLVKEVVGLDFAGAELVVTV